MTHALYVKQRHARDLAIESRRNQRRNESEYCSLFERVKSTFDGRFEELCHFAVGCALDQKRLASEYKLVSYELADIKDKANLFSQNDNPNVTHRTKFAVADLLIKGGFDGPSEKAFMAGASASRKNVAASGGNKRSSKITLVREFAIKEYSQRSWKNTKLATRILMESIVQKADELDWHMSEETREETIYKWLLAHKKCVNKITHSVN